MKWLYNFSLLVFILSSGSAFAQSEKELLIKSKLDTSQNVKPLSVRQASKNILAADTITIVKHNPRKATLRSAILPGWGQAYNKSTGKFLWFTLPSAFPQAFGYTITHGTNELKKRTKFVSITTSPVSATSMRSCRE